MRATTSFTLLRLTDNVPNTRIYKGRSDGLRRPLQTEWQCELALRIANLFKSPFVEHCLLTNLSLLLLHRWWKRKRGRR